jgi:hypothetical protein
LTTLALCVSAVSLWIETLSFNYVISSAKIAVDSLKKGKAFLRATLRYWNAWFFIFGVFNSFNVTEQLARNQSMLVFELRKATRDEL